MGRMCAPWGHDVVCTRCVELRPFVPNDEPAEEHDLDAAADASVEVHVYIHRSTPVDTTETEMGDDGWPTQLDRKLYIRLEPVQIPLAARRAHLRQVADRLGSPVHEASLFHVFGGKEVTVTLGEALEQSPPELANGPVRIIVRQPIEYRCSYARPPALVDASHASL